MSDVRAVLTEALAVHKPTVKRISHPQRPGYALNLGACTGCDWTTEKLNAEARAEHDSHVADVLLALPSVAVTQLPEPKGVNSQDNRVWQDGPLYIEQEFEGDVIVNDRIGIDADHLRETAGILLAAAVLAEGENRPEPEQLVCETGDCVEPANRYLSGLVLCPTHNAEFQAWKAAQDKGETR